jgi:hypothetical protein
MTLRFFWPFSLTSITVSTGIGDRHKIECLGVKCWHKKCSVWGEGVGEAKQKEKRKNEQDTGTAEGGDPGDRDRDQGLEHDQQYLQQWLIPAKLDHTLYKETRK